MILAFAAVTIFSSPVLRWTGDDIVVGGYSVRQAAIKAVEADERGKTTDNDEILARKDHDSDFLKKQVTEHGKPYCSLTQRWSVLSAVGPIVSYRQDQDEYCVPAAHPWGGATYHTLDARRPGHEVSLLDYFQDRDVLKALLADKIVTRALTGAPPRSVRELEKRLELANTGCEYGFWGGMVTHFAFHHLEGNQVAVRIGLSHGCEAARGTLTQLGILLPIPSALRAPLQAAAARKGGFLMNDRPAGEARLTWGKPY